MFSAALPEDDSRARLHALFTGRQVSVRKRGCGVKGEAGAREEKVGQTDGWKSGCTQRRPTGVKIETRELGAAGRRRQVAFCRGGGVGGAVCMTMRPIIGSPQWQIKTFSLILNRFLDEPSIFFTKT